MANGAYRAFTRSAPLIRHAILGRRALVVALLATYLCTALRLVESASEQWYGSRFLGPWLW
jgi:hypothetical protein